MPTIEVSQEQAEALARGENITVAAPKRRRYIIVFSNGNVYDVRTTQTLPEGTGTPSFALGAESGDDVQRIAVSDGLAAVRRAAARTAVRGGPTYLPTTITEVGVTV